MVSTNLELPMFNFIKWDVEKCSGNQKCIEKVT